MASAPDSEDLSKLSPEERERLARHLQDGRLPLDQEIARRYDPKRLARMVVAGAGSGEPIEGGLRSRMERQLGGDFRNVRVVRGAIAEEFLGRHRADAAAIGGTELVLVKDGPRGNFQTPAGAGLLAHELTHVQQQQRGLHFSGAPGERTHLEEEAEASELQAEAQARGESRSRAERQRNRKAWITFWRTVIDQVVEREQAEQGDGDRRDGNPGGAHGH